MDAGAMLHPHAGAQYAAPARGRRLTCGDAERPGRERRENPGRRPAPAGNNPYGATFFSAIDHMKSVFSRRSKYGSFGER